MSAPFYTVDRDAFGDLHLWLHREEGDPAPKSILTAHEAHPHVWAAACVHLGAVDVAEQSIEGAER